MKTSTEIFTPVNPVDRWGQRPLYQAKVGSMSSSLIVIRRTRKFTVGQRIQFAELNDLQGMSTGCTPRWQSGIVRLIEDNRIFVDRH